MAQSTTEAILPYVSCPPGKLFPDTVDILRNDPLADCTRVGVGTTIFDNEGRILMLAHKASLKCAAGALGPMTETVQWADANGTPTPEATLQTMARATREELEVSEPNSLGLRAQRIGGWFLTKVPVGDSYPGQFILAICPVVHITAQRAELLVDNFASRAENEIERLTLMYPDEIRACTNLRSLAMPIISGALKLSMRRRLYWSDLSEIRLPDVQTRADTSDDIPERHLVA